MGEQLCAILASERIVGKWPRSAVERRKYSKTLCPARPRVDEATKTVNGPLSPTPGMCRKIPAEFVADGAGRLRGEYKRVRYLTS